MFNPPCTRRAIPIPVVNGSGVIINALATAVSSAELPSAANLPSLSKNSFSNPVGSVEAIDLSKISSASLQTGVSHVKL